MTNITVSAFMPEAVAAMLRKAPLTSDKVAFAWRTAVGPAVDKATRVDLRDGVLRVDARDRAWKREVERSAAIIRMRLDALLGPDVIRDVVVTADSPDDRARALISGTKLADAKVRTSLLEGGKKAVTSDAPRESAKRMRIPKKIVSASSRR